MPELYLMPCASHASCPMPHVPARLHLLAPHRRDRPLHKRPQPRRQAGKPLRLLLGDGRDPSVVGVAGAEAGGGGEAHVRVERHAPPVTAATHAEGCASRRGKKRWPSRKQRDDLWISEWWLSWVHGRLGAETSGPGVDAAVEHAAVVVDRLPRRQVHDHAPRHLRVLLRRRRGPRQHASLRCRRRPPVRPRHCAAPRDKP